MTDSQEMVCTKCNATTELGAVFCTNCGARLPEKEKPLAQEANAAPVSAPVSEASIPEAPRCGKCQAPLERGALFCTNCGARVSAAEAVLASAAASASTAASPGASLSSQATEQQTTAAAVATSTAQSETAAQDQPTAFATGAAAAQPVYESPSSPSSSYAAPALGEAPAGRKTGPVVIAALLLLIIVGAAVLWLRPSGAVPAGSKVLILTPQRSSLSVEPNATAQLGVAVRGDGGAGVTWKIQENYGGRVEAAGVTVQGQEFIYTAAYHAGNTPGDYHVVATSLANKDSRVTITVRVER